MEIPQDERFREEAKRHNLRWNCEDCVLFRGPRDGTAEGSQADCLHGFPTARHLRKRYLDHSAGILFCKHFELG